MATVTKRAWTDGNGRKKEAWRISYTDASGKRRFVQRKSKKEADAYALTVQSEIVRGVHTPDADSLTVSAAADLWLANAEQTGCERGTVKSYRELARCHIVPLIGAEKLSRLTAPKVHAFADAMILKSSKAMASKAVRGLSMIIGEAQRRGLIAQNVAASVTVKQSSRDRPRAIIPPKQHLRALLEAADRLENEDPRLPVLIRVAMFAGLRQSELRGLLMTDVDLAAGTLTVSQKADRWNEMGRPKSAAGTRTVPIGPALVKALRRWKLRCPPTPTNLMFPARRQGRPRGAADTPLALGPMKQHAITDRFLAVQIAAGLAIDSGEIDKAGKTVWKPRYGLHALRHAAASAWINQGVDLKRLQVWIGHANITLTLNCYGHLLTDAQADAALASGAEEALFA
jgi:integrase